MNTLAKPGRQHNAVLTLVLFLALVIGVGSLIGATNLPGEWYASLQKPPFNPPSWIFAPVWFVLYVLIALAGWRTYQREGMGRSLQLWIGQMLLNWLWSPVFFTLHWLWAALAVIILMLVLIVGFIVARWNRDRLASWLFVPYAAWVSFATLLNASIAILN